MKSKTNIRRGNYIQTLAREAKKNLRVKTNIKAGLTCRKAGGDQQEY